MKHTFAKLTPVALACGLAMNPVMAEDKMSVHGQINVSADMVDITPLAGKDNVLGRMEGTELKSNASRFGLSGSLDTTLENTKLIYKADVQYTAVGNNSDGKGEGDSGDGALYLRDAYAGLKHKDLGRVRMGRFTVGYKSSYTKIDPWTDHILQARDKGQQGASNLNSNYFNYAVDYTSPKMNGFQVNAHYSVMADENMDSLHNSGKLKDMAGGSAHGFGVKYFNGGLRLTADTVTLDSENDLGVTGPSGVNNGKAKNGTANKVSARYKFKSTGTSIAGMYEDVTDINLGENMFAVVTQKVGKHGLLTATVGTNKASDDNAYSQDDDSIHYALGAKYKLTKKSALIAGWNTYERGDAEAMAFTVGIDAKFGY